MIKVGIIGMGIRGNLYAKTIKYNANAEVVAVARGQQGKAAGGHEGLCVPGYADYNKMLDEKREREREREREKEFHMVMVALPDHLHKDAVSRWRQRSATS